MREYKYSSSIKKNIPSGRIDLYEQLSTIETPPPIVPSSKTQRKRERERGARQRMIATPISRAEFPKETEGCSFLLRKKNGTNWSLLERRSWQTRLRAERNEKQAAWRRGGGGGVVSCSIWNSRARRASSVYRALQGLRKIVGALER